MAFAEPVPTPPATAEPGPAPAADDAVKELPSVLAAGDVVMLGAAGPDGLQSRPVTCAEVTALGFRCLVDRTAAWTHGLLPTPAPINATRADDRKNDYVSMTGEARLVASREDVAALWSAPAAAFFEGPDDPRAAVLEVVVSSGQWWSGPSGLVVRALSLVRAAVTDRPESVGEQGVLADPSDPPAEGRSRD